MNNFFKFPIIWSGFVRQINYPPPLLPEWLAGKPAAQLAGPANNMGVSGGLAGSGRLWGTNGGWMAVLVVSLPWLPIRPGHT